ncbi:hypothetical protein CRG98_016884 [Punica granatum]|uniref:Uncharacterized protein n=1 Tax=Punica granatum TaxID=22663 RepID=A0A2I0K2E7_PUNGR|nr:hypothetical protein CRG98_016884 [Punica granatum]
MAKWTKHGNRSVSRWKNTSWTCVVQGSSRPHSIKEGRELSWLTFVGRVSSAPIRDVSRHVNMLHTINDKNNIGTDPIRKGGDRPSLEWAKGAHGSLPRD